MKQFVPYSIVKKHEAKKEIYIPSINMPEIYNFDGDRMMVYFLKDSTFPFWPYSASAGAKSKYILWDRANYGLNYHFYTHYDIFTQIGKPSKKYALQLEGESTMPKVYEKLIRDPKLVSDYEIFFTHNDRLLQILPNAKPIVYGGVWYGTSAGGGGDE